MFLFHANLINDSMIGGDRLKYLPHLSIFIWLSTLKLNNWIKISVSLFGLVMLSILSVIRYPAYTEASKWVDDYMECEPKIKSHTKLLTINYEYNGMTANGSQISTQNWAFIHGTSYIGAMKPMILADNYQAHMGWFPLNWKDQNYSFYNSTSKDIISFENRPPRADIMAYPVKSTKGPIEYVLVIGQTDELKNHEYGQEIDQQLIAHYSLICTSKTGRSKLYEYNSIK